eukprot:3859303-Karenia_brevis.AAC.1
MTLPLCAAQWSGVLHQAFNESFDEYGPRMALLLPMKLVNIGNVNLGGINAASWGTNVQMFANSGDLG